MSLKKYMVIDLAILSIVGAILEGIGTWACFYAFTGSVPTTVFSLLILFIAITRWKWWGIVVIPFLVFGNYIGIASIEINHLNEYISIFNVNYVLSNILGLFSSILVIIFQKMVGTIKFIKNNGILTLTLISLFLIYESIRISSYWLLGGRGYAVISANFIDIISLIMLIIGSFIIRNEDMLVDMKSKLIENTKIIDQSISFNINEDDMDILKEVKNI